jgi:hypothetical protein
VFEAMTLRSRERRRKEARAPAIWRGPLTPADSIERPAVQHGTRRQVFVSWRVFSAMIVFSLSLVLLLFFSTDVFYIHSVTVGGLRYLTKEEVFALTDVANLHVFWVDPDAVREAVLRSPTIADARVYVTWPPNMVQIIIEEREPALVWEQAGAATWIDLQGRVMRQYEDRPDLLRVAADQSIEGPLGPNVRIDAGIVNGAVQLHALFPDVSLFRYNPIKGLGYRDLGGWDAWFGIGTDMPEKYLIYQKIVSDLRLRGIQPVEVNLVNPDAPYYCCR